MSLVVEITGFFVIILSPRVLPRKNLSRSICAMTGVLFILAHHEKADYRHRHHDSGPTGAYTTPHQLHIVSVGVGFFISSGASSPLRCIY